MCAFALRDRVIIWKAKHDGDCRSKRVILDLYDASTESIRADPTRSPPAHAITPKHSLGATHES